jgi:hypothetical protein
MIVLLLFLILISVSSLAQDILGIYLLFVVGFIGFAVIQENISVILFCGSIALICYLLNLYSSQIKEHIYLKIYPFEFLKTHRRKGHSSF